MKFRLVIVLLIVVTLLTGCAPVEPDEIRVGVIAPITGPVAIFGEDMQQGFDLAVEEINVQGGVNGKPLRLIYEDTTCIDNKATISALTKFKDIDKVAAVLGPFCGGTNFVSGQFSNDHKMFIISPGDNLGKLSDYKFHTRYLLQEEAFNLAKYALSQNYTKVGILYFNNEWGQGYRDNMKLYLEENGGELVAQEAYTFDNLDVRTQLLKIKESGAQVVMIADGTGGELFNQAKEIELNLPLLSEWEINKPESYEIAGDALEGVVFSMPGSEITSFHSRFEQKYGDLPNVINVDSYDAAKLLAKSLQECIDYDVECMSNFMISLQDYPGAGGSLTFNTERWTFDKPFALMTYSDGKVVPI